MDSRNQADGFRILVRIRVCLLMSKGGLMGFDDAIKLGFANYVNFSGRASRSEYWYWVLFTTGGEITARIIDGVIGGPEGWRIIYPIFALAIALPTLSVTVRRLHDLDYSSWWILLPLILPLGWMLPGTQIPLVGGKLFFIPLLRGIVLTFGLLGLILFIFLMCSPGTDGLNRFGANRLARLGAI